MELKLTNVARASLEELRLDYEDFLRQRGLSLWLENDPRRRALVAHRCKTADEVAAWCREVRNGQYGQNEPHRLDGRERTNGPHESVGSASVFIGSMQSSYAEIAANAAHVLVGVASALLGRQIERLAADFEREGGFTERLYRVRARRRSK